MPCTLPCTYTLQFSFLLVLRLQSAQQSLYLHFDPVVDLSQVGVALGLVRCVNAVEDSVAEVASLVRAGSGTPDDELA